MHSIQIKIKQYSRALNEKNRRLWFETQIESGESYKSLQKCLEIQSKIYQFELHKINTQNTNTLQTTSHKVKGNTHIFLFFYFSSAAQQHQICTLVNFFFPNFLVMCLCGRLLNFVPNQLFCDNLYFAPNWVVV